MESWLDILQIGLGAAGWFVVWLLPLTGLCLLTGLIIGLPIRRQERSRLFLDLLQVGLDEGKRPEQTVTDLAKIPDQRHDSRIQYLAQSLEMGYTFPEAIDHVPSLLPAKGRAVIKAGSEAGDIRTALTACKWMLSDAVSRTRGALNYLVFFCFAFAPMILIFLTLITNFMRGALSKVTTALHAEIPGFFEFVIEQDRWLSAGLGFVLVTIFAGGGLLFILDPNRVNSSRVRWLGWLDRLFYSLPWHRNRMKRDFSSMLVTLLDGGLPEEDAVYRAGHATTNRIFMRKAESVRSSLRQGVPLHEAVNKMDVKGGMSWHLQNAFHRRGGFREALAGWQESLDARAFQQEQTAAQLVTSLFVLLIVGWIGIHCVGFALVWARAIENLNLG